MNQTTIPLRPPLPIRPPPVDPDAALQRHATALAEMQQLRDDYQTMLAEVTEARRTIDRLTNRTELLETSLSESRQGEKVYRRKLIRLASAMDLMTKLAADAEVIMRDAKEVNEAAVEEEIGKAVNGAKQE
jgi:hypothetical protein